MTSDQFPTYRFFSPRNLALAVAIGAGGLAVLLRLPLLAFCSLTCLAAVVRSVFQASRLLREVRVERRLTARAFEGQTVPVEIVLECDGPIPNPLVLVDDYFPPSSMAHAEHLITDPLTRRERVTVRYSGECTHRRGLYVIGPLRLTAWDDLGFLAKRVRLETLSDLLVYPMATDLHFTTLLGDGTLEHVGMETKQRAGMSEEFVGLRDYRPGDSPGHIHWRSTARNGRPMVKEFHEEITTQVSFFIDLGRQGLTGLGDQTSVEYAIKATASLAKLSVEKGHAVQLFAIGSKIEHIPPGSGTSHLLAILDRLAFLKVEGDVDFPGSVARYLTLVRPGGTAVLLLGATTIDFDRTAPVIAAMKSRRILPLVVLIDDRAFIKLWREQEERHVQALSLEDIAKGLTLMGVRVHLVTKARSPEQALVQGLERRHLADAI